MAAALAEQLASDTAGTAAATLKNPFNAMKCYCSMRLIIG
jgi:hypothetical protein